MKLLENLNNPIQSDQVRRIVNKCAAILKHPASHAKLQTHIIESLYHFLCEPISNEQGKFVFSFFIFVCFSICTIIKLMLFFCLILNVIGSAVFVKQIRVSTGGFFSFKKQDVLVSLLDRFSFSETTVIALLELIHRCCEHQGTI